MINSYVSFIRKVLGLERIKETQEWRQLTNIVLAQANRTGWKQQLKMEDTWLSKLRVRGRASCYLSFENK